MKEVIKSILNSIGGYSKSNHGLEFTTHSIKGLRRNWDYEVVTKSIFDDEGEEYLMEEDIPQQVRQNRMLQINEERIETDEVFKFGDKVDIRKAKMCGIGVIRSLNGDNKGDLFMYFLDNTEPQIQLLGYQALVYGTVHEGFKQLVKRQEGTEYVKMILGKKIGGIVVDLLEDSGNLKGGVAFGEGTT